MTEPYFDPSNSEGTEILFGHVAARYVQDLAPAPAPVPDDYADLAAAAEYLVYNYLTQTSGVVLESESARGVSANYVDIERVKALIAPVMGSYYQGSSVGDTNTAYIGRFP